MLVVNEEVKRQITVEEYLVDVRQRGTQNCRDNHGIPTLCSAIDKFRSPYLVDELLKDGVDVNTFSCFQSALSCESMRVRFKKWGNFAPIHLAVSLGLYEVVKLLLENGADLKSKTTRGIEPVDFLLSDISRCLDKNTRFSEANDFEILKLMYAAGVDLNTKDKWLRQSTLLHRAAILNNQEITQYLVNLGCDVNCVDTNGKTPLWYCNIDALECARILLQNGANPNSQDNFGDTKYHHVCGIYKKGGNSSCLGFLRLLHDWNVDPNVRNHVGETALHVCFKNIKPGVSSEEMIDAMLKHGADPNVTDELERTPVHYLISCVHVETWNIVWSLLIKSLGYGAILNKVDIIGMPLLHRLVESCLSHMKYFDSELFIGVFNPRYNVKVNCQDLHNRTVLHLVSAKGNWTMAKILLKHGASMEIEDCDGNAPLHVAILCKQWAFARKLLLLPLRSTSLVDHTSGNKQTNLREENAVSEFRQIRRNVSIPDLVYQNERSNHILQKTNNRVLHCSTDEFCRNTNGGLENFRRTMSLADKDKACVTSGQRRVEWTSKMLGTIAKYVESNTVVVLDHEERKGRFCENIVCPAPTIRRDFFDGIKKSSLLELCEENSVGEFHLIEECEEEHCLIAKQVFRLMTDLVQKCSEIDPRLKSKLLWTGSSAEGTKMWLPDEFDFLMEIVGLRGKCELDNRIWTSFRLLLRKECQELWSNFCLEDSCILSSTKLKRYISTLLWKAACLLDRKNYKNIRFRLCEYDKNLHSFIKTTKVGVNITVCWCGEKYKNLIISIDLTSAISVALTGKELSNIHKHSVGRLLGNFIHVIPYVKNGEKERWRPSFSLTEVHIMKELSQKQIALYKGLKFFRDIHKSIFAEVPSYHLKTFFFNYIFVGGSGFPTFLAKLENFHSSLCHILYFLNLNADGNIRHLFLNYHLNLSDYDIRWIKSTLNILENC